MEPKLAETTAVADRAVGAIDTLKTRVVLEQEVGAICLPNLRAGRASLTPFRRRS